MVVEWANTAKLQLKNIYIYYKEVAGTRIAHEIIHDIQKSARLLAGFPQMAAIELLLEDLPEDYRSLVVRHHYKVVYYVDEANKKVVVVTVFDCRQNPDKLKNEISNRYK
jgi:plasmid stabilization system protein ParE